MAQQPQRRVPKDLIAGKKLFRAWRGTPGDLMTIAQRARDLAQPLRERALEQRRAEIEALFDSQIASARQSQPPAQLPGALDALLKAKEEARRRAADELATLAAYEELFSVTLKDNTIIVREAERLFTAQDFPQGVKAVNMIVRIGPNAQVNVALANANPYYPQLEVNVAGPDPGWVQGSASSMVEVIGRGQPFVLWHWRAWLQPYVLPTLVWAFFAWFFAVVFEHFQIPVLSAYPWLAIFAALLPAAGALFLLQRAIPPFGVSRSGQETATDVIRGLFVTLFGAALLWLISRIGVWLSAQSR